MLDDTVQMVDDTVLYTVAAFTTSNRLTEEADWSWRAIRAYECQARIGHPTFRDYYV